MALANAVQTALRPSQIVTWTRDDGTPENLTGATLTGKIRDYAGVVRDITGTLTLTTPATGVFTWAYSAVDVAEAGQFLVQFTASFGSSPTPAKTIAATWNVYEAVT